MTYSGVEELLSRLNTALQDNERLWLIEQAKSGMWSVAIVRDVPEQEWPEPTGVQTTDELERVKTTAYRRAETLDGALLGIIEILEARKTEQKG